MTNKQLFTHRILPCIVVWCVVIATNVAMMLYKAPIVQNIGIRSYSAILMSVRLIGGILLLASIILLIVTVTSEKKRQRQIKARLDRTEQRYVVSEESNATLSMSKPLEDRRIRAMLKEEVQNGWVDDETICEMANTLYEQSVEMDSIQEKLQVLLSENEATKLNDTVDLLNQVEQYILRNIRKVLNCFQVYDADKEEDIQKIQQLMQTVINENNAQLKNVREFLFALADFLNQQGNTSAGIHRLNIYKDTILESIKKEDNAYDSPFQM